jgi:Arc/MetJ-type ribon-helix-helix transcriptional regulator
MTEEKGKIRKRKENVTITMSPYLKKQLDVMVESGDFSSLSDLATMALSEFVAKYTAEKMKEADIQKEGTPKSTTYKMPFYVE